MRKLFILLFLFIFLSFPKKAFAIENFSVTNNATYVVSENGVTRTTFKFVLTNTQSTYYASTYAIHVGFDNLTNVTASDPDGTITPKVEKTDNGYSIEVAFNKKVAGIGNTLPFTISFDTSNIAKRYGRIWEVNIPGVAKGNDFSDLNVSLQVPQSFGKPTYIKPSSGGNDLEFTNEELQNAGISVAFGQTQAYEFNLQYHIKNGNLFPITTEIALPPSTNYQDVFIDSIEPKPRQVRVDKDGNWLAEYSLLPSQRVDIQVTGTADLFLTPKKDPMTKEELKPYLEARPYWQTSDNKIKELAKTLKTPEAIYEYVVKTLSYDLSRVTGNKSRLGAVNTLQNPKSAVCLEFTDLFIALARAAGIPAREIDGYANTENSRERPLSLVKDVLHAWPQYYDYDKETWVMIDPTWGNTTNGVDYFHILDFDHFTFVIKGLNSSYPVPAGGYKIDGLTNIKDVHVSVTQNESVPIQNFQIQSYLPGKALSAFPIQGTITIKNTGNALLSPQTVSVDAQFLNPHAQGVHFQEIPPFGYSNLTFEFDKTAFLTNEKDVITIQVADKSITHSIVITPFILPKGAAFIIGGIIFATILGLTLFVFTRKRGRIPLQK